MYQQKCTNHCVAEPGPKWNFSDPLSQHRPLVWVVSLEHHQARPPPSPAVIHSQAYIIGPCECATHTHTHTHTQVLAREMNLSADGSAVFQFE